MKHDGLTRKWTLADIRRLDCSIMRTYDQRLGNIEGNGKKCHTERLDMIEFDKRLERTF